MGLMGTTPSRGPAACVDGMAGEYACSNIDLGAFVSHADLGSTDLRGSDIWYAPRRQSTSLVEGILNEVFIYVVLHSFVLGGGLTPREMSTQSLAALTAPLSWM